MILDVPHFLIRKERWRNCCRCYTLSAIPYRAHGDLVRGVARDLAADLVAAEGGREEPVEVERASGGVIAAAHDGDVVQRVDEGLEEF